MTADEYVEAILERIAVMTEELSEEDYREVIRELVERLDA